MPDLPTPARVVSAATNVSDKLRHGHLADLRLMPREVIDQGPQRAVYRYTPNGRGRPRGLPVLLVPPLAAPALCFDLRRGCSLVEHLVGDHRRTYLVDYGEIAFSDRNLGVEHWVEDVVPRAVEAVSRDAGGAPVLVVGWCLGGIFTILAAADRPELPIAGIAAIATPFDISAVPLVAPLRPLVNLTGGALMTAAYRVLGGAPAPIVKTAFQVTSFDKWLSKPLAIATHLDDREFLAQIEAVDRFMSNMHAYPGRSFGQLYHRLFRANELTDGHVDIAGHRIELANVRLPVLVVAGRDDVIAPKRAVQRLGRLMTNAPWKKFRTAPGGHLGVLTGRAARRSTWVYLDEFLKEHGSALKARRGRAARQDR